MVSNFDATALCFQKSSARLAILYESDLLFNYFSSIPSDDYWINLFKSSSTTNFFHSRFYESNSTWSPTFWDGSYSENDMCAMYRTDSMNFRERPCSDKNLVMCEIVL